MGQEYIEPMVVDRSGNIYISMREYQKDMNEIKSKLKEYRNRLLDTRRGMKKLAKANKGNESIKALGYIESINYLQKELKELIGEKDGRDGQKATKNN